MARLFARSFRQARARRARPDSRHLRRPRPASATCWSRRPGSCSTAAAGTEIILNNIGDDVATYRVSVELRRMTPDGKLVDVDRPNAKEKLRRR